MQRNGGTIWDAQDLPSGMSEAHCNMCSASALPSSPSSCMELDDNSASAPAVASWKGCQHPVVRCSVVLCECHRTLFRQKTVQLLLMLRKPAENVCRLIQSQGTCNGTKERLREWLLEVEESYGGDPGATVRCLQRRLIDELRPSDDMDESQFLRQLGLFPMVRTRDYCADDAASSGPLVFSDFESPTTLSGTQQVLDSAGRETVEQKESTVGKREAVKVSHELSEESPIGLQTNGSHKAPVSFWELLQQEVGSKLGQPEAQRYCDAFRAQHDDLVNKTLSLDAIERISRNLALVHK